MERDFCSYCLKPFSTEEILSRHTGLKLMVNKEL